MQQFKLCITEFENKNVVFTVVFYISAEPSYQAFPKLI